MTRLEELLLIERELEKIGYDNKTEKGIYLHEIAFKYATGKYVSKDEFKKCFKQKRVERLFFLPSSLQRIKVLNRLFAVLRSPLFK